MTKFRSSRPALTGSLSRLLPAVAAVTLAWGGMQAHASQVTVDRLNAVLTDFAEDKLAPTATLKSEPTTLTANADDLVYAVYQLALGSTGVAYNDSTAVQDLVTSALEAVANTKGVTSVRADKDKIASRILNAALMGSGLATDPLAVADAATALANVNGTTGNTKFQLTVAGQEAVVAQALKSSDGDAASGGQTAGEKLAALSIQLAANVPGTKPAETKLQTFALAALKLAGTADGQISEYTTGLLASPDIASKDVFTAKLAEGSVKVPSVAGQIVAARAAQLAGDSTGFNTFTNTIVTDAKLGKSLAWVVGGLASAYSGDKGDLVTTVVTDLGKKATTANRAAVAAGAIQNATSGDVAGLIDKALTGVALKPTEYVAFATGAATGTGDLAGDVVAKVSALSGANNPTVLANIGIGVLKSISTTSPESGEIVAQKLIESAPSVYNSDTALTTLAQTLASKTMTSGPTAGAAVAGVASKLSAQTDASFANLAIAVIPKASKAASNISLELAKLLPVNSDFSAFATNIASHVSVGFAGNVAAGVAVASIGNVGGPANGQTAGDIAAGVAQGNATLQAKAAIIAGTVATAVDVESIAGIGGKIGALYKNKTDNTTKLPKITAIGSLATSLAKAINTKPFVTTSNRVDELGELAAEMTRQAVAVQGASDTTLAKTITTIGTSVMKGLSASLQQNGGAFAADLKDASQYIAGAIAQTISVQVAEGRLTREQADSLIVSGGALETALKKAAKAFGADVVLAFNDVRGATGNTNGIVTGDKNISNNYSGGSITTTGKYEIGSVIDNETPFQNLP